MAGRRDGKGKRGMKIKIATSLFILFFVLGVLGALLQVTAFVSGYHSISASIPHRFVIHQAQNSIRVADDGIETHGGGGGGNKGGGTHWHA